jgi:pyruvate/2-oxoglutarate/acetoin dehydrogenase E1 component
MKNDYHIEIKSQMEQFATDPKVLFLGQQVLSEDFYDLLTNIPIHCRREMPVAEDMQLGLSIGLALEGYLPISIYQRMDFLPRAMDQLVNHLNLIAQLSRNIFTPKVIIFTTIGTKKPLDVGLQHSGDLTELMKKACNFPVFLLTNKDEATGAFNFARYSGGSTMIIAKQELFNA